ncbi:hypothetical protein PEPS_09040 [Persicobacter psychrovividus]|uniref:Uncharacterized protein n=1 Tax=Persicobacter psychrovividus TaxID=387638 RepID=A0ABM7VCK1_9BACT|nr:hypothetical protein PEPS_09040 [Persicobacter psychrovividus]
MNLILRLRYGRCMQRHYNMKSRQTSQRMEIKKRNKEQFQCCGFDFAPTVRTLHATSLHYEIPSNIPKKW